MKKTFPLIAFLMVICFSAFSQNIVKPQVDQSGDYNCVIDKIESNAQLTTITFTYTASGDNSWALLNKEIYIQTDLSNEHYNYVKSENIAIAPAKHVFAKTGDKLTFKISFKKIPTASKTIDLIERAGLSSNGQQFFNFYGVSLIKPSIDGSTKRENIRDITMMPPPVNKDAMSSMGTMYASLVKSMLDANLAYYKQSGKIAELARLNKDYYDALLKVGFGYEAALKIITSNSLFSKPSSTNGQ